VSRSDRRPRQRLDVRERRSAILDAAKAAFAGGSYEEVSVAAVAEAAGASEALVLRYFGSKAALYVEVVEAAIALLLERQLAADAALGPHVPPVERVAESVRVYLDFVAAFRRGWAGPLRAPYGEPAQAEALRTDLRRHYVHQLRALLGPAPARPRDLALHGYLGFVDAACLAWVDAGCPDGERVAIVEMAVAALRAAVGSGRAAATLSGAPDG
jgi:AcrR family transcriptional regulator